MDFAAPLAASALIWWVSTCTLLWLVGQRRRVGFGVAIFLTFLMIGATALVYVLRDDTSQSAAYLGFATGIVLWAWHEAMFLFGYITGPRKSPCPPGLKTWARFKVSAEALIHHEVAIAAHAVIVVLLSLGAENQMVAMTFVLLWAMRLSSKMVIFLGAPNVAAHFLPDHLAYLGSYFKTSRATPWFAVFGIFVTAVAGTLIYLGFTAPAGSFSSAGYLLLAGLAWLAVFEHAVLVMPIPDKALWSWAHSGRKDANTNTNTTQEELDYGRL